MFKKYLIFSAVFLIAAIITAALPEVDLEITGPAVLTPETPNFGDKVTVQLYIYNYGPDNIVGPIKIDWKLNGKKIGQTFIMNLNAEEQKEIKNSFKLKQISNKLSVSVVTKVVPYNDSNNSNDTYEEDLDFSYLTEEETPKLSGQHINDGSANIDSSSKGVRKGPKNQQSSQGDSSSSGSSTTTSSTGSEGSSTGLGSDKERSQGDSTSLDRTGKPSDKNAPGNPADSSSNISGSDTDAANNNSSQTGAPDYPTSDAAKSFVKYIASYLKINNRLKGLETQEQNASRRATISSLIQKIDSLHKDLTQINGYLSLQSASASAVNINGEKIEAALAQIKDGLGELKETGSLGDEYIDNAEKFIDEANKMMP